MVNFIGSSTVVFPKYKNVISLKVSIYSVSYLLKFFLEMKDKND